MPTKEECRAMIWDCCFSVPLGFICVYLGAPIWAIPLIFLAGFIPTLLKLTERYGCKMNNTKWFAKLNPSISPYPNIRMKENATLIAAAPDRLAALKQAEIAVDQLCVDQHQDNECWNILRSLRAAIAKAEGRS